MASSFSTKPFPRLSTVSGLTWEQCFAFDRRQILQNFVAPLRSTAGQAKQMSGLAKLLYRMISEPFSEPSSVVVLQNMKSIADVRVTPKTSVVVPEGVPDNFGIGEVKYLPSGTRSTMLFCHTIYDVLSALMSEAAYCPSEIKNRTVDSYYAMLVSLHKYWCLRVDPDPRKPNSTYHRPSMTSIFCFDDVIVLGCTLPRVPRLPDGKEIVKQIRNSRIKSIGRQDESGRQILNMRTIQGLGQDYGHCAETWGFAMFCQLQEKDQDRAFGVAMYIAREDVKKYVAAIERTPGQTSNGNPYHPYAPMCVNCEKMTKEIVRQGRPKDDVLKNFSVSRWEWKEQGTDGRWPHLFPRR